MESEGGRSQEYCTTSGTWMNRPTFRFRIFRIKGFSATTIYGWYETSGAKGVHRANCEIKAYIWNFYVASQIVLRESLVNVIYYAITLQGQDGLDGDNMAGIQKQRDWVEVLSTAIIESFPLLLGFTNKHEQIGRSRLLQQGRMAGRLSRSLFHVGDTKSAIHVGPAQADCARGGLVGQRASRIGLRGAIFNSIGRVSSDIIVQRFNGCRRDSNSQLLMVIGPTHQLFRARYLNGLSQLEIFFDLLILNNTTFPPLSFKHIPAVLITQAPSCLVPPPTTWNVDVSLSHVEFCLASLHTSTHLSNTDPPPYTPLPTP